MSEQRLSTVADAKTFVSEIIEALDKIETKADYSVLVAARLAIPTRVTSSQLSTFMHRFKDALSCFKDEYIFQVEFKINQYDDAGIELAKKIQEIQQAKSEPAPVEEPPIQEAEVKSE